ncbi:MAG: hypothetical protein QNJ38_01335 [Prochloraceae cyanobacterium]|nr:hypothetical protein [Prochloraceae cyanobacterium]
MAFFTDVFSVPTLTELKAIASTGRRDRMNVLVAEPATGYIGATYSYRQNATLTELLPIIAVPNDTQGAWVSNNPIYADTAIPSAAPPLIGIIWVATLTSPDRVVTFRSVGTSADTDWIPVNNNAVVDSATPSHSADFIGQIFYDNSADEFHLATDTFGTWQLIGSSTGGGTGY